LKNINGGLRLQTLADMPLNFKSLHKNCIILLN